MLIQKMLFSILYYLLITEIDSMLKVEFIYETGSSELITPDPKFAFKYYKKLDEKEICI
jgi:TPR repeat protein